MVVLAQPLAHKKTALGARLANDHVALNVCHRSRAMEGKGQRRRRMFSFVFIAGLVVFRHVHVNQKCIRRSIHLRQHVRRGHRRCPELALVSWRYGENPAICNLVVGRRRPIVLRKWQTGVISSLMMCTRSITCHLRLITPSKSFSHDLLNRLQGTKPIAE